ncbi:MAG: hypothetical protein C0418_02050 [Coriobacteriaceae bacterium]|nr:hypothetical protein [Coriobacteriaceae bacterium]
MTRIRRGGYEFVTWVGDHPPRHVHVLRDGRFVVKWNLDTGRPMAGHASPRILEFIHELRREGRL